ncbi:MAG TPA: methionine adenosyltransferase domain-containing protein, partial [Thermoanaerobacterales bacterium]|nr:methionine adenosyltransferase domain-containing protein [Thermoanaerobacterales bacterium]
LIDTFGTEKIPVDEIQKLVADSVDLRPAAIIERFSLRSPIYSRVACYGHFGENAKDMPWEQVNLAKRWIK